MATDTIPALQNLVYRVPSWDVRDIPGGPVPAMTRLRQARYICGASEDIGDVEIQDEEDSDA